MATLVLNFTTVPNAQGYRVEYSSDEGTTFTAMSETVTASPVIVLSDPSPGTYVVRLTALGDGVTYADSEAALSDPVTVEPEVVEPTPLDTPVIDSLTVEE